MIGCAHLRRGVLFHCPADAEEIVGDHTKADPTLHLGGYKQSGWGREMGEEVLHSYTEVKAVTTALY